MPNELPYFPLYTSDIMTAIASWPVERAGAYFLALCYQWEHGYVPTADAAELGLVLHVTPGRARKLWVEIAPKFVIDPQGHARNERLENIRAQVRLEIATKSNRGKAGAGTRWERFRQRMADAQASTQAHAQASPEHYPSNANQNQNQYTPPKSPAPRGTAQADLRPPSRKERERATAALNHWRAHRDEWTQPGIDWADSTTWPQCPHDNEGGDGSPACASEEVCIGVVVQRWRLQRADGQQRALEERQAS